ncbi:hypothetical protein GQ600_24342 [Phytophthora cactorum]|nr:hypothetical protein GQ600_24342 [Phytophthora cactorum]
MILQQQRTQHLRGLFFQSRRLADQLTVVAWHHLERAYNKMADKLANMAMDARRNVQMNLLVHTIPAHNGKGYTSMHKVILDTGC